MKQVQTNLFHAFGGRLMQGIDGMLGRRWVWLRVWALWYLHVTVGLAMLCQHETSSNECVSCIWRWVDAGNMQKVG